jgi:cytochrome c peroxidase
VRVSVSVLSLLLLGCPDASAPAEDRDAAVVEAQVKPDRLTALVRGPIGTAITAAVAVERGIERGSPKRADYLALRRHVAAARPFIVLRAQLGSEVLLGPARTINEGGGALGALDAALFAHDMAAAGPYAVQVVRSLRLIDTELTRNVVRPTDVARALSDTAYELGLVLLEADPLVAFEPDAVMQDIKGLLDAIDAGAVALDDSSSAGADERLLRTLRSGVAGLRRHLDEAPHAHLLQGRARLVRISGNIGVAARQFASALGHEPRLPYEARYPIDGNSINEPITPFTVPAPRADRRGGNHAAMAAIGQKLFFDKRLSKRAQRACSGCHKPEFGYSDARAHPPSLVASPIVRNTPTLLYTSLHAAQLWDGQLASAESQALKVIHTEAEMGLTSRQLEAAVSAVPEYAKLFSATFDDGVTAKNIARTLVAFEVSALVPASSPVDRFSRGDLEALTKDHLAGLDVFAGVGRCARCHIPPLFGGSRPTDFAVPIFAALGVPRTAKGKVLDTDPGRGKITERKLDHAAFKTPTVRNVHLTAPYFHHGAFPTLEDVVDFYDDGGGKARGIDLPNQDPDVRKLELGKERKRVLLVFMREALRDQTLPILE